MMLALFLALAPYVWIGVWRGMDLLGPRLGLDGWLDRLQARWRA